MEPIYRKFLDSLVEAEKAWKSADYLVNVTFPILKDPKLLIRALESLDKETRLVISVILQVEYLFKRIELAKDREENMIVFVKRCAKRYGIGKEDEGLIKEILFLGRKHKESGFEFGKDGKAVILDDFGNSYQLDREKMKTLLKFGYGLLENTNRLLSCHFRKV